MVTIKLLLYVAQIFVCLASMVTVFQWSSAWLELLQTLVDSPDGRWQKLLPEQAMSCESCCGCHSFMSHITAIFAAVG